MGELNSSVRVSLAKSRHGENVQRKTLITRVTFPPRDFKRLGRERYRPLNVSLSKGRVADESNDMTDLVLFSRSPKHLEGMGELWFGQVVSAAVSFFFIASSPR